MPTQSNIHRLVSLTFDEDPKVRKEAAKGLGEIDDPASLFALLELSYDKDASVKKAAQEILKEKKSSGQEVMSFADMFSAGRKVIQQAPQGENTAQRKERVLSPITQLFERSLGKEKADAVRSRMMPTIEKVYFKITDKTRDSEGERKVIQEFLTSYLEAIASIDSQGHAQDAGQTQTMQVEEIIPEQTMEDDLEEIGQPKELGKIERDLAKTNIDDADELPEAGVQNLPDTIFKKAYETMMLSGGDEKVMKREMKRMLQEFEHDLGLAFYLARKKFKETKITQLTKLKDGMRNVNTEVLEVKQREYLPYAKGKQKKILTRFIVSDIDGGEGVVYLFDDRGTWIQEGMKIQLSKGHVKTFDFSKETALTIGNKGNVYIVV